MARPLNKDSVYNLFVELDQQIYNPGDVVNGALVCRLEKKLFCDELIVQFEGKIRVSWTEQVVTTPSHYRSVIHEQKKDLVDESVVVWHWTPDENLKQKEQPAREPTLDDILRHASSTAIRTSNMQKTTTRRGLDAGTYRYEFTFVVPPEGMHTAFETPDNTASVRYSITALAKLNGFVQCRRKHCFPVVVPRPLSQEPRLFSPQSRQHEAHVKKLGSVEVTLSLAKSGFVPGEPLAARVLITNRTTESIKYAHVNILQRAECTATNPCHSVIDRVYPSSGVGLPVAKPKLQRGESIEYTTLFNVPALTPSIFIPDFLSVDYDVQLAVGFKRASPKDAFVVMRIPITIGTSPINEQSVKADGKESPPPSYSTILAEHNASIMPSAPPAYEDIAGGDRESIADNNYVPLYYSYGDSTSNAVPGSVLVRSGKVH